MREAEALAGARSASMVAPAGCGKTQVIAHAVAHHSGSRVLVLTHTHAGVDALRHRLRRLGASAERYQLTTIASWALRLATHYPATSGILHDTPTGDQWEATYPGASRALLVSAIREAVRASYGSVYVDEYQDCTQAQHDLVVALRDVLPCRVVGDPLQGIFGFRGAGLDWEQHVRVNFPDVPGPTIPHRWAETNPDLGAWLQSVRGDLLAGRSVELRGAPVRWIRPPSPEAEHRTRVSACRNLRVPDDQTVTVVFSKPWELTAVARSLSGQFSCIEPIEADGLFRFAEGVDAERGPARAACVLTFAGECITGVRTPLRSIANALAAGREPSRMRKNPEQRDALIAVARSDTVDVVTAALDRVQALDRAHVFRRELLAEARKALRLVARGDYGTVSDAARAVRDQTRILGRALPRRAIGTTLVIKGLEFDHAIIVNPAAMDARNLYVALTRGRRSLTIVSSSDSLVPAAAED